MPNPDLERRRVLGSALLAGVVLAVAFVTVSWGRLFLAGRATGGGGQTALGVVTGVASAIAWSVPFLLAVLLVVAAPSRRTVVVGAGLVYVSNLLLTVGQTVLGGFPAGLELVVLAVPLTSVVQFLAVATAVWLAYHGGYERLVEASGNADQHPLFAAVADKRLGPALSLQRGLVVAGVAALVGAGGLVLAGGVGDLLRVVARLGTPESTTIVFPRRQVWRAGIPPARLTVEWLFEASFLLAILFVTGPRARLRDFLKGLGVVFGIQATVELLPALVPPSRPVDVWGVSGPVLTPLSDATLLFGITVAVWLAFHRGTETLRTRRV